METKKILQGRTSSNLQRENLSKNVPEYDPFVLRPPSLEETLSERQSEAPSRIEDVKGENEVAVSECQSEVKGESIKEN